MATPKKNVAYQFYISLVAAADPNTFQINPTIAIGDFKISKDGGALTNLATLPSVVPAGSRIVQVDLSAAEMNADKVIIQGVDVAGAEWQEVEIFIDVPVTNLESVPGGVWDEALNQHNIGGTSGKALRQIKEGTVSAESQVNDTSATTTVFATDLTEAVDDFYIDVSLVFIDGALTGQSRTILAYQGATKTIILDEALTSVPGDGDGFIIKTDHIHPISQIVEGVWETEPGATVASDITILTDIQLGDRIESNDQLIINKQGTITPVLDKKITGSLLTPNVTIRTTDT